MTIRQRIWGSAAVFVGLLIAGTMGFHFLEEWSILDSAYMTVITLTTVGYGDLVPISPMGKAFTMVLILGGVGTMAFALTGLYETLLSDDARHRWTQRRRQRMIDRLQDHVILCGFGQMGRYVARNFAREKAEFVVIDEEPEAVERAKTHGYLALEGSGSQEDTLERAGVARAKALIIAVDSDAESVFICLTARALRKDIQIVSRANRDDSRPKLMAAGADRVILPYALSGQRMVSLVHRPAVAEFVDVIMKSGDLSLCLEDIIVPEDSSLAGKSLAELRARQDHGVTVLGILHPDGSLNTNPQASDALVAGAHIISLGTADHLEAFADYVAR